MTYYLEYYYLRFRRKRLVTPDSLTLNPRAIRRQLSNLLTRPNIIPTDLTVDLTRLGPRLLSENNLKFDYGPVNTTEHGF